MIANNYHLNPGEDVEVTIHDNSNNEQVEIWGLHPEDINTISFSINEEVHTMNMYNRIYVPEKYRFFFPNMDKEFLLVTNVGNIKTHITSNGYFTKGLRQWFYINGPIMPNDEIFINIINEKVFHYEMVYKKVNC